MSERQTTRIQSMRRRHGPGCSARGLHASECISAQVRHRSIGNPRYIGSVAMARAELCIVTIDAKRIKAADDLKVAGIMVRCCGAMKSETEVVG